MKRRSEISLAAISIIEWNTILISDGMRGRLPGHLVVGAICGVMVDPMSAAVSDRMFDAGTPFVTTNWSLVVSHNGFRRRRRKRWKKSAGFTGGRFMHSLG